MYPDGEDNSSKDDFLNCQNSYLKILKEGGCYYLSPEICKNIIVSAGVIGLDIPIAIKIINNEITNEKAIMDLIPFLKLFDRDTLKLYSVELAQSLLEAAINDKGIEISIGYPKLLVIDVN